MEPVLAEIVVSHVLNEAVEQWIAELDTAKRTKESYRKGIKRYVSYLHAERLQGDQRTDVLSYKAHRVRSYSANTVNSYLVPVRRFYTWLSALGAGPNVAADIKGAKLSRGFKKDYLTAPQAGKALGTHTSESIKDLRDNAIIALMVHTGLRTVEVARANIEDMHPSGSATVLDIQGKGRSSKDDFVVVPVSVEDKIRTYLLSREDITEGEPLFASISPRNTGGRMTTRSISRIAKDTLRQAAT